MKISHSSRVMRFSFWPSATAVRPWQVQAPDFTAFVDFMDTHRGYRFSEPLEGLVLDVDAVDALLAAQTGPA